jgi:uncharacterized metal-binding protein YceD (DUF177 family)
MLKVKVTHIPPEGKEVDEPLDPGQAHLEGEDSFALRGGRFRGLLERGDDDSVHVRGHLTACLGLQCGRCLEPFDLEVDQPLDLFYLPHREGQGLEEEEDVALRDRDMVIAYYRNDLLDLGEMVREQLFLGLPMRRVCRDTCKGLCPACGVNRNSVACLCPPDEGDLRLAPLKKLFEKGS